MSEYLEVRYSVSHKHFNIDWLSAIYNHINKQQKPDGLQLHLDPANLNSPIPNSPVFQSQNHFPRICPSVICYWLLRTPTILNYILFLSRVENSRVQLFIINLHLHCKVCKHQPFIDCLIFHYHSHYLLAGGFSPVTIWLVWRDFQPCVWH